MLSDRLLRTTVHDRVKVLSDRTYTLGGMSRSPKVQRVPPPFRQIADHYALKIRTGHLKPGDLLPSLPTIMETWGVSRVTASKANDRLRNLGLVEHVPGKGLRVLGEPAPEAAPDPVNDPLTPAPAATPRRPRPAPKPAERRTP